MSQKSIRLNSNRLIKLVLPWLISTAWLFSYSSVASSSQASQTAWPVIHLNEIAGSLNAPVYLTQPDDASGRLFVVEQVGRIRILSGDILRATPFLDISSRVLFGGEQGLLSMAFPPKYASKGYFYVYYTGKDGNNQLSRFYLSADPQVADPNSEKKILSLPHPTYTNHNGGQLTFGPDGYLYIGTGDGGGGGDPFGNAQNLGSLLGKILRIDVEKNTFYQAASTNQVYLPLIGGRSETSGLPYAIPADNPFRSKPGARGEIWTYGLRNPWRFSFDRLTKDLFIADVGQDRYEEVDFQPPSGGGDNYGWNIMEGLHCYPSGSSCNQTGLVMPILEYSHGVNDGTGCAITGGYVYRGGVNTTMIGYYFYADYCSGRIWAAQKSGSTWQSQQVLDTDYQFTSFGEDQLGNLYLMETGGRIFRVVEGP